MKKLIFILLATIWCIGANGQKIGANGQKKIGAVGYWEETNTTFPDLETAIDKEYINCNEIINVYDIDWLVFYKDTLSNGTIILYYLSGWYTKEELSKYYDNNECRTQTRLSKFSKCIPFKKGIELFPFIHSGTYSDIRRIEAYEIRETSREYEHKWAYLGASQI